MKKETIYWDRYSKAISNYESRLWSSRNHEEQELYTCLLESMHTHSESVNKLKMTNNILARKLERYENMSIFQFICSKLPSIKLPKITIKW